MKNKLVNRVLVGVIFAPLVLIIFYLGGVFLEVFLGILSFAMLYELRKNFNDKGVGIPVSQLFLGVLVYIALILGNNMYFLATILASAIILSLPLVVTNDSHNAIKKIAIGLFSIIYISFFLAMFYRIRIMDGGREMAISLILTIWITDTFAYFTGVLFGKHKGVLAVSPNKSLEGFIGGFVFSFLGSFLCVKLFGLSNNLIWMLGISAGIFGQYGDLFESLLKRDLKIKDSSRILSEHGGVLDRFDSLLFSAPALYVLISFAGV